MQLSKVGNDARKMYECVIVLSVCKVDTMHDFFSGMLHPLARFSMREAIRGDMLEFMETIFMFVY